MFTLYIDQVDFVALLWMLICLCGVGAYWSCAGRAKRLWQVAVLALLGSCALIPAPELVATFAAQCATVWVGVGLGRLWPASPSPASTETTPSGAAADRGRFSFSLRALLTAMLLAGAVAAPISAARDPKYVWPLAGLGWGVVTLAAVYWEASRARAVWRYLALGLIPLAIGWALARLEILDILFQMPDIPLNTGSAWGWMFPETHWPTYACAAMAGLSTAVLLRLGRQSGVAAGAQPGAGMKRRVSRGALVVLCGLLIAPPLYVLIAIPRPTMPQVPPLAANGYDEVLKLAPKLDWRAIPSQNPDAATIAQLDAFAMANAETLKAIEEQLRLDGQKSLRWTNDDDVNLREIEDVRSIARAFGAAARAAERNARFGDAVGYCESNLRLGSNLQGGGLLIDRLQAQTVFGVGLAGAGRLCSNLDAEQCHELISQLDMQAARWEPLADTLRRDQLWEELVYGWPIRLEDLLVLWRGVARKDCRVVEANRVTSLNLLRLEIAIRLYSLEHGQEPNDLSDLAPKFLADAPNDLFSDKPLIYRRAGAGHVLYSVGMDGKDDGGNPNDDILSK